MQITLDVLAKTTRRLRRVKISIIRYVTILPYKFLTVTYIRTNQRKTRNVLISTALMIDQTRKTKKNKQNTRKTNTSNPL